MFESLPILAACRFSGSGNATLWERLISTTWSHEFNATLLPAGLTHRPRMDGHTAWTVTIVPQVDPIQCDGTVFVQGTGDIR